MWGERLGEFVTLFLVINPFGVVPAYLAVVGGIRSPMQRRIAMNAVVIAFVVLAFFLFAGSFLLEQLHVPLRGFQIAGGIVLFIVAIEMIRGEDHAPQGKRKDSHLALAIYPLAIPKIAGPAAMLTIVLISDDDRFNVIGKLGTLGMLALVMVAQIALLLAAVPVSRLIGPSGAGVIGRVMGMLLAALAVSTTLGAIADWLNLPKL